jgi:hypothetical protein
LPGPKRDEFVSSADSLSPIGGAEEELAKTPEPLTAELEKMLFRSIIGFRLSFTTTNVELNVMPRTLSM